MVRIILPFWKRLMHSLGEQNWDRFLLWIDAVGGYWVCRGDSIAIGQPDRQRAIDVPLLGDVAGCHVRLHRQGEDFLLEALHETRVNGKRVQDFEPLGDGCEIQLGSAVRLQFRRPHPLSGTVRLDFLSRHRTQPSTDAVLWMADTCLLGPKRQNHVICRDWPRDVILFRDGKDLFCRTNGVFKVDGVVCQGNGRIADRSRVAGEGFSFSFEPF
jgi:hypothetical protein